MKHPVPLKTATRRRGIALVVTISVLALATILLLAMFSVTESEFKSTQSYVAGQSARQLGESAVNIVINQIQTGSSQSAQTAGREFHATQPGVVRRYTENGAFLSGHKLYSDSRMTEVTAGSAGEQALTQDVPPTDWDSDENKGRYVDMNEPAITADAAGQMRVMFPVVDPRAYMRDTTNTENTSARFVEGFSYSKTLTSSSGGAATLNGVVEPTGSAGETGNDLRLPMPVEWVYQLKDGTLGTLDESRTFQSGNGIAPTAENPIVGRIAFWTDDESCKINVNTASEPTYWGLPITYHERAHLWAERPPTVGEYQRFPGHPSTVALSSVLFPFRDLDQYGKATADVQKIVEMKEAIYRIMPKINNGGSIAGTVPYAEDDLDRAKAEGVDIASSIRERLYASLDEILFSEQLTGSVRAQNELNVGGNQLITPQTLERARFFLTASSRSPDFSMLGVPRIAMWPIADESLGQQRRSIYDKMIAFCATLDPARDANEAQTPKTYFFRRKDAHSTSTDVNIARNQQLLDYLYKLMGATYPRGTLGTGSNFVAKYGDQDARQIIISIFDYVRATNTYDSYLAPAFADLVDGKGTNMDSWLKIYTKKDQLAPPNQPVNNQFNSYTEPRYRYMRTDDKSAGRSTEIPDVEIADKTLPGHGQVSPSQWRVGSGTYMGYGRSVTLSEAALHFICTADGQKDANSYRMWVKSGTNWNKSTNEADRSGGRTTPRIKINDANVYNYEEESFGPDGAPKEKQYWYSNYPPFPSPGKYGTDPSATADSERWAGYHPGYNPENWNTTLERDTPLAETEKRIQAALNVELFCPAVGWGKIHPELTVVLDGRAVSAITVNGKSLFATTTDLVVKTEGDVSRGGIFDSWDSSPAGGTVSFRNFVRNKRSHGFQDMPNDPAYVTQAGGGEHANMANVDLISSPITIDRTQDMQFVVPEPIRVDIYDDHNWQGKEPLQTITLRFPVGPTTVMCPDIVTTSTMRREIVNSDGSIYTQRAVEGPRWWAFNYAGGLNRYEPNSARTYVTRPNQIRPRTNFENENIRCCGRLRMDGNLTVASTNYSTSAMPASNGFIFGNSTAFPGVKNNFTSQVTRDDPNQHFGTDVVRSIIPKYGDYRIIAARRVVSADMFVAHPLWNERDVPLAHNLTAFDSDKEAGFDRSGQRGVATDPTRRLVKNVAADTYEDNKIPDMPHTVEAAAAAARYRDFDNGVGPSRDGAYINKPDEGNFSALHFWIANGVRLYRNAYYHATWETESGSPSYFTPNRMVASPVIFGSLPTGVWGGQPGSQSDAATHGVPWRTLLFRPDVTYPSGGASHAGNVVPRDHYILDLFTMPVVEPYAISEPLSIAGRINVNYQMLPFSHIRRTTGLNAVLKGEVMSVVPKRDAKFYLRMNNATVWPQKYWEEKRKDGKSVAADQIKYWHRTINIDETLKQLDDRFNMSTNAPADGKGLLRSASQFCEIHLIPANLPSDAPTYTNANVNTGVMNNDTTRKQEMGRFWDAHALTGDNSRERPYASIYPRLTSRSNTFRVHVRAQSIRKARSTNVAIFDPNADAILGEYRGSTLVERYIDPNDTRIPEYADGSNPLSKESLDTFYRFRVIENKRFVP